MLKTVIVVDTRNSALSIVANQRSRIWHSTVIYADEFRSPKVLVDFLLGNDFRNILIAWRGLLWEGLELQEFRHAYQELVFKANLHLIVPDYLGLEKKFFGKEELALSSVHNYSVTSQDLMTKYAFRFGGNPPTAVLHDIPDIELIKKYRDSDRKEDTVIWVGNSKWGENYGFWGSQRFRKNR